MTASFQDARIVSVQDAQARVLTLAGDEGSPPIIFFGAIDSCIGAGKKT